MGKDFGLKFSVTVSERGQIFIPKVLQGYFDIRNHDKVIFVIQGDGSVVFKKKEGEDERHEE